MNLHQYDDEAEQQRAGAARSAEPDLYQPDTRPTLPGPAPEADRDEQRRASALIRRFHLGSPGAPVNPPTDLLPALLSQFRDPSKVRIEFPLFLHAPTADLAGCPCTPLGQLLVDTLARIAPDPGDARILKDNLPRVELFVRGALEGAARPVEARRVLESASRALKDELRLRPTPGDELAQDFQRLIEALPEHGQLLAYGANVSLRLLMLTTARHMLPRLERFREELSQLASQLRDLLRVEEDKGSERRSADALAESVSEAGGRFIDTAVLSTELGPARGSQHMDTARRERVEQCLEVIETALAEPDPALVYLVHNQFDGAQWLEGEAGWDVQDDENVCRAANRRFNALARRLADVLVAVRLARLEVDGRYDPAEHDGWYEAFDWQGFTEEELQLVPPVVAHLSAERLTPTDRESMTRLLLSGKPVRIFVEVRPARNPGVPEGVDPLTGFRIEHGYLGISYRQALVQQTTAARPTRLVAGLVAALNSTRTSLHVLSQNLGMGGIEPRLGAWLHAGAALEGRAHPFFLYDPDAGDHWAERLDFEGNPQPEQDWPVYELACLEADGAEQILTLPFTFADYALLDPELATHFLVVPSECSGELLVPMAEWADLSPEDALHKVPYVWGVGTDRQMVRVAVSRRLSFACRDRLAFWNTLQELAGINDEYAYWAAELARAQAQAEAAEERKELERTHARELELVGREAASAAMQRLAAHLMDRGVPSTGWTSAPAPPQAQVAPAAPAEVQPPPVDPEPPEEELSFDEPWIDTPLCTTCNECTALNSRLFVYDSNKQATIGDPRAGTFAQLVTAAEKCPARCIHPGKPLDPEEPGLPELVQRASKFN